MAMAVLNSEKEYEIVAGQAEVQRLGGVHGPDPSFQICANERLPDGAFVAAARIPAEGEPEGIWSLAPCLAVEIISPSDLYEKVNGKGGVFRRRRPASVADLSSDDLLSGFRCRIRELFQSPTRA
jgi:hypothetical protein